MSATSDVEFLRCLSATEVRAVLGAGRPVTVLLLDSAVVDRDLIAEAHRFGVPTVLVHSTGPPLDWADLGCVATLHEPVGPTEVMELIEAIEAQPPSPAPLMRARSVDLDGPLDPAVLIAVTGTGGCGVTTVAMLIAEAFARRPADRPTHGHDTVLVDATDTDGVALYHDLDPASGGIRELIEMHRRDRVDPAEVRALTQRVGNRPYGVIVGDPLGSAVSTSSTTAAAVLDGLGRTFATVVVDAGTLSPASPSGSSSIGALAVSCAQAVVVVGRSGLHGVHRLVECADHVTLLRGPGARFTTVCAAAPRSPAERRAVVAELEIDRRSVVFIPTINRLERVHRDVARLPGSIAESIARPVRSLVET
jgi:hypothetical protein